MQDHAFAHSKQVDSLLAVIHAIINPFDRKWIAQRLGALLETHTLAAPVFCGLGVIPFERLVVPITTEYQYSFQESSSRNGQARRKR
jgi:uncharacterized membrane protein YczE